MSKSRSHPLKTRIVAVPASAPPPAADAPLLAMIERWRELGPIVEQLERKLDECINKHVLVEWTQQEIETHRIERDPKKLVPLIGITEKDIEYSNEIDSPCYPRVERFEEFRDNVQIVGAKIIHPEATEEEMEAWRGRCAARRRLWDEKDSANRAICEDRSADKSDQDLTKAATEQVRLQFDIVEYYPLSVAGALEKVKWYSEYIHPDFEETFEDEALSVVRAMQRDMNTILETWPRPATPPTA